MQLGQAQFVINGHYGLIGRGLFNVVGMDNFPENEYRIGVFAIDGGAGETYKRGLRQGFVQVIGKAGN